MGDLSGAFTGKSVQISHCAAWISQHAYLMWAIEHRPYSTPEGSANVRMNSSVHAVPIDREQIISV